MGETTEFGRYQLIKKLAAGGMAQVWLARQPGIEGFEKLLVIKQVLPHLADDDNFITMFLDEARLAARLNHPNVVQVYDLGQVDESLYIAMEYIHGEDLRRLDRESRRRRKPIPIPLVCRIIADAAAGLHYAHTLTSPTGQPLGIVHRDVSPQNLLSTFEGGVKVVDFGIAKAADRANKTRSGVLKGKYAYMSPEQASGKKVDARTDVFALGIMLHELLTGRRLFKRDGEVATLQAVVTCDVQAPSAINPVVPRELDPIVLSALAQQKEKRLPDAGSLQLALEDFLTSQRLPASSAHLKAYMREVFAERLEIEAQEGGPAGYLVQRSTGSSRSVGLGAATPPSEAEAPTTAERPGQRGGEGSGASSIRVPGISGGDAGEGSRGDESSPGSVSRLAASLHRRRDVVMGVVGLVLGVGLVGGALYVFGDGRGDGDGEVPTRVSGIGAGQDASAGAGPAGEKAPDDPGPAPEQVAVGDNGDSVAPQAGDEPSARSEREAGGDAPSVADTEPAAPNAEPAVPEAKEVEATPPPRTTPAPGTLRASVSPGAARVEVRRGRAWRPVRGSERLLPGSYPIRVVLPDGAVHQERVQIASGQVQTFERSYGRGTLRVVVQPFGMGGEVRIGGRAMGQVPGPPIELYEGRHAVEVRGPEGKTVTERVVVRAGEQATLTVQLR